MVVQRRDHRCHHEPRRNARLRQLPDRVQPPPGRRGARFHRPRQLAVQGGDGNRYLDEALPRHLAQNVDVAGDQRRLGDDADRVLVLGQHLQHLTRDPPFPLDGLVGIGVGADGDHPRLIAGLGQFPPQELCSVRLGKQLALKVEPGGQAHIGMGGPRETIDAAMLAAPIGIDGPVEGNVRRLVAGDDGPGRFVADMGAKRTIVLLDVPPVVKRLRGLVLEAPGPVGTRAATFLYLRQPLGEAAARPEYRAGDRAWGCALAPVICGQGGRRPRLTGLGGSQGEHRHGRGARWLGGLGDVIHPHRVADPCRWRCPRHVRNKITSIRTRQEHLG